MKNIKKSTVVLFGILSALFLLVIIGGIWVIDNKIIMTALWVVYGLLTALFYLIKKRYDESKNA